MNETKETLSLERIETSRTSARAFGQHYDYDVSYMEALLDASPGAYMVFEQGMGMSRYQHAAPNELLSLVKITTTQVEDCGPCLALGIKFAREAGVAEEIIRGALNGGRGLSAEHLDIYHYARAVAANDAMDPELLPRLQEKWGKEVMAELALAIIGVRTYPAMKRALGYAQSCSLMPDLLK